MELSLYEVSDCCEKDWVVAESPLQASMLSLSQGCHCDHNPEEGDLDLRKLTDDEAAAITYYSDVTGKKEPMLNVYQRTKSPAVIASTCW